MTKQLEAMKMALEALNTAWVNDIDRDDHYYMNAITALREAIEAAEGYVLVPVEPTEEMLNALGNSWTGVNIATWQRLIAAAPKGGEA